MDISWYTFLQEHDILEQGDIIYKCPSIINPDDFDYQIDVERHQENINVGIMLLDIIVLSQSCDIVNDKTPMIVACPFIKITDFFKQSKNELSKKEKIKQFEKMQEGHIHRYHLLECSKYHNIVEPIVVDFGNVRSLKTSFLKKFVSKQNTKERVRLQSPYREHLSQSFAKYFMRVGLPSGVKTPEHLF